MTKTVREEFPWDERGVFVHAVKLSLFAKASKEAWRSVVTELGADIRDTGDGPDAWSASFYALPSDLRADSHYLSVDSHLMLRDPDQAHWMVDWAARPRSEVPRSIATSSERVGGYPGVLERLTGLWPEVADYTADISVTYALSTASWSSRLSPKRPRRVRVAALDKTITATAQSTSWQLNPHSGIVATVSESVATGTSQIVFVAGSWPVPLHGDFVRAAERRIWDDFQSLLEPTGKK